MSMFGGKSGLGMRASRHFGGHKRKTLQAEPEQTQEVPDNSTVVSFVPKPEQRSDKEQPRWRERGLFAVGGVLGAPRVRSVRKNTK